MTEENSFPRCDRRKVLFRESKFHTLPTCNRAFSILQPMSETWRISVSAVSPRSCRGTCWVEIAHLAFLCTFSWRHLYALCGENGAPCAPAFYITTALGSPTAHPPHPSRPKRCTCKFRTLLAACRRSKESPSSRKMSPSNGLVTVEQCLQRVAENVLQTITY
jgi:hypothetical protein